MHAKTTAAIDAICEALDTDPSAPEKLMAALCGALGLKARPEEHLQADLGHVFAMFSQRHRSLGAVEAYSEIITKASNLSAKFLDAGDQEMADAFLKFSANIVKLRERADLPETL